MDSFIGVIYDTVAVMLKVIQDRCHLWQVTAYVTANETINMSHVIFVHHVRRLFTMMLLERFLVAKNDLSLNTLP